MAPMGRRWGHRPVVVLGRRSNAFARVGVASIDRSHPLRSRRRLHGARRRRRRRRRARHAKHRSPHASSRSAGARSPRAISFFREPSRVDRRTSTDRSTDRSIDRSTDRSIGRSTARQAPSRPRARPPRVQRSRGGVESIVRPSAVRGVTPSAGVARAFDDDGPDDRTTRRTRARTAGSTWRRASPRARARARNARGIVTPHSSAWTDGDDDETGDARATVRARRARERVVDERWAGAMGSRDADAVIRRRSRGDDGDAGRAFDAARRDSSRNAREWVEVRHLTEQSSRGEI